MPVEVGLMLQSLVYSRKGSFCVRACENTLECGVEVPSPVCGSVALTDQQDVVSRLTSRSESITLSATGGF